MNAFILLIALFDIGLPPVPADDGYWRQPPDRVYEETRQRYQLEQLETTRQQLLLIDDVNKVMITPQGVMLK